MSEQPSNTLSSSAFSDRVKLFQPDSAPPELSATALDYKALHGPWHVVASTLPLWKNKQNVVITYAPIEGEPPTTFDDIVSYNSISDKRGKKPSLVKGVDRLEEGKSAAWKWRGKGLLMIASSHWQLLGASLAPATPEWAVTYFSKTLFTPAGLDVYARGPKGLSDEQVDVIVKAIEGLGAYTIQTELAQYVQQTLNYRRSYFLFYLTHTGYVTLLPLHLLVAAVLPGQAPLQEQLATLKVVLKQHYGDKGSSAHSRWVRNLLWMSAKLSVFIAVPSCSWYMATPLTSMTEITALYNLFAFWAYLLAVKILGERPSQLKLASVLMAIGGVIVISFGGATAQSTKPGSHPLIGDMLALLGSVSFAFYEVWFKINISLPDQPKDPNDQDEFDALLTPDSDSSSFTEPSASPPMPPQRPGHSRTTSARSELSISAYEPSILPHLTPSAYLLYSSTITTLIGLSTLLILWLPLPFLHLSGLETFQLPPLETVPAILGVVFTGVAFNGGFIILISVWGPLVASVGNLCTLLLVAVADTWVTGVPLGWMTVAGSGLVVVAFGMLIAGAQREKAKVGVV